MFEYYVIQSRKCTQLISLVSNDVQCYTDLLHIICTFLHINLLTGCVNTYNVPMHFNKEAGVSCNNAKNWYLSTNLIMDFY